MDTVEEIDIIEVVPGDLNYHLFTEVPKNIYQTSLLTQNNLSDIPKKHLLVCFVVLCRSIPIGRIAIYKNPELTYQNSPTICWGGYECIDHIFVSQTLMSTAYQYSRTQEANYIIGPMNGSTWENYRFIENWTTDMFFTESFHPSYYIKQWQTFGLRTISSYISMIDRDLKFGLNPSLPSTFDKLGIKYTHLKMSRWKDTLEQVHSLNEIAFQHNFLYTSINFEEFLKKIEPIKSLINPRFVKLAYSIDDVLIAYYFCIDDIFNKNEKSLIIKSIARHPASQFRGLGVELCRQVYDDARMQKYKSVVHAFMHTKGRSLEISKTIANDPLRRYHLYGKAIY